MNKIISIKDFIKIKEKLDKKIVCVSGSFDLFHVGHLEFLKFAKSQADLLVVLLNSDKSISMYKGKNRPIIKQNDRAKILSELLCVDYVIIFNELTPIKYMEQIKPNIFCNGLDWAKNFVGKEILENNNCKIIYFKKKKTSASSIIQKIINSQKVKKTNVLFHELGLINDKIKKQINKDIDLIIPINKFLNSKSDFIRYCAERQIIINNSYVFTNNNTTLQFAKIVNLKTILLTDSKATCDEDACVNTIDDLRDVIKLLYK